MTDKKWIEDWLVLRFGADHKFNIQFCKDLIRDAEPLIRADERAKCDKEKAEFGLSVHESAVAMTLKEVGEWLSKKTAVHGRLKGADWKSFKKGEMP